MNRTERKLHNKQWRLDRDIRRLKSEIGREKPQENVNEVLKSLSFLARLAGSPEEIESVKMCLEIYKRDNKDNPNSFRMFGEINDVIRKREFEISLTFNTIY